jgi:hypothetical protein
LQHITPRGCLVVIGVPKSRGWILTCLTVFCLAWEFPASSETSHAQNRSEHQQLSLLGPRTPVSPPLIAYHGEVMLAADPESDKDLIVCGFRSNERSGSAYEGYVYHSGDGGKTWREVLVDANSQWVSEESCTVGPGHQAYFAAGESDTSRGEPHHEYGIFHLYRSPDGGRTWQSTLSSRFMDWTSMAADSTLSARRGTLYIFANALVDGTDTTPIDIPYFQPSVLSAVGDKLRGWSSLAKTPYLATFRESPELSFSLTSGGFNLGETSIQFPGRFPHGSAVLSDGTVLAIFSGDQEISDKVSGQNRRVFTIDLGMSNDGGGSLSKKTIFEDFTPSVVAGLAVSKSDEIYVCWTPQNENAAESRLMVATSKDGAESWTIKSVKLPPETLLDLHMGSVSIAINKDGVLGFMWYSKDSDHVYFGASFDGGQSISKVVQLTPNLPSIPARERPLADDRRLDIYSPAWNNNSNRLEPLTILAFSPNFSGIPGGNGLVADRSGTFHAVWDEVTNGAASLWTRTITLSESGENAAVPTLEGLTDVSNKVSFNVSDVRLDQLDDLAAFDLVVTNRSDTTLLSPVLVILASPSGQPEMSAYNADNGKLGDGALWELQLPSGRLAPGHSAEPRTLILRMKIPVKDNLTTYQPAEIPLRIYAKLP